jgi:hypothetical protein
MGNQECGSPWLTSFTLSLEPAHAVYGRFPFPTAEIATFFERCASCSPPELQGGGDRLRRRQLALIRMFARLGRYHGVLDLGCGWARMHSQRGGPGARSWKSDVYAY